MSGFAVGPSRVVYRRNPCHARSVEFEVVVIEHRGHRSVMGNLLALLGSGTAADPATSTQPQGFDVGAAILFVIGIALFIFPPKSRIVNTVFSVVVGFVTIGYATASGFEFKGPAAASIWLIGIMISAVGTILLTA